MSNTQSPSSPAPTETFTVVAHAQPRDATLERVLALLRRRAPSPHTLTIAAGHAPAACRITLTFEATRAAAEQVTEQLRKLVDIESAACFTAAEASDALVVREFALIRMRGGPRRRREILDVARLFAARIVDARNGGITLEASGPSNVIEHLLAMLRPLGVEEVVRSGGLAMRCSDAPTASSERDESGQSA